ncbi:MAG: DUF721 domain-containing protein [Gemmatimonadota bacterium]
MSAKTPAPLSELLGNVLKSPRLQAGMARAQVVAEWDERVGEKIAAVSSVRSFSEGTLFVEVRSSAWLMELEMMKRDILARLNQGQGKGPIEKIVFVQAATPTSPSPHAG